MATKTKKFKPPSPVQIAKYSDKLKEMATRKKATDLAVSGHSYDQISEKLGIPVKEAFNLVKESVEYWQKEISLNASELRDLDVARLEALIQQQWPYTQVRYEEQVVQNKVVLPGGREITVPKKVMVRIDPDPMAVKLVVTLMERKHKILGLDAQTVKLEDPTGIRREYVGVNIDNL